MGWHTITIWECELKPKLREQTLESLAYTLNHIWLEDQKGRVSRVSKVSKVSGVQGVSKVPRVSGVSKVSRVYGITEDEELLMAAEEEITGQ